MVGMAAHVIGHAGDVGKGNQVIGTGAVANADRTDAYLLGAAGNAIDGHNVAGVNRIFNLEENSGNHVFYQGLRPETDGQTEYPGTGDERPDVNADFCQNHNGGTGKDNHRPGASE